MPENTNDPVAEVEAHLSHLNLPNGHKIGIPTQTTDLLHSLARQLRDAREDARRWKLCVQKGFPRFNNTMPDSLTHCWYVYWPEGTFYAGTPESAVDAAIQALDAATLRDALEPSEEAVTAVAKVIANSPLIDAPKLPYPAWMGLARNVLNAATLPATNVAPSDNAEKGKP